MIRRDFGPCFSRLTVGLSLTLVLCMAGTPALANVIIDLVGFDPEDPNTIMAMQIPVVVEADNTFQFIGSRGNDSTLWKADIDLSGDVDPFTNLAFSLTNNAAVTLQFLVGITLPTGPLGPATLHGGSTVGGATDANAAGGVTLSTVVGIPFYAGKIDAATVLSIYPDPTVFSAAFGSVGIPALNPGLPGPTLPSGAVLANISITHEFTLTAGDSMSATSFFQVEAIPEPATCGIAFSGLIVAMGWRRRR